MGRAGGLLVDGTAEEHLRIGALEDAGDAGAPLELLLIFLSNRDAVWPRCWLCAVCGPYRLLCGGGSTLWG